MDALLRAIAQIIARYHAAIGVGERDADRIIGRTVIGYVAIA